jgi:translation elongation factor EF-Ts
MSNSKRTVGDEIALSIGSLGENMILRRAVILNLKENESLAWYMHGSSKVACL